MCYGQVDRIVDDTEVFINIQAMKIEGKIGFGGDVGGVLECGNRNSECGGIVFVNHVRYEDMKGYVKKGIKGLVCNTISYSCLKRFLGKDIGVALTGNEDIPFSLILLHGFSGNAINNVCTDFSAYTNQYVLLKPYTQIRAGATRPSVYVQPR
jgi:hypothetical protein